MRRYINAFVGILALVALACTNPSASGADIPPPPTPAPGRANLPSSMAALGDSITLGYGACFGPVPCPRNSWATGDGFLVNSHYRRILAGNPAIRGRAHNYAQSGGTVADLAGQARRAVGAKVAYVTILIGANDACRRQIGEMTSTTAFDSQLRAGLAVLRAGLPKAHVLLLSIPDVYRVWQVAHTSRLAREIWKLGVCPSLLANPASTAPADTQRRQQFRDRIDAYDRELAAACTWYGARCRYDGGAVHGYPFSLDTLSALDYFHPNSVGQQQLAQVSYPGTFTWGGR
jgi:lysophospholipase L1-like esterase